MIKKITIILSDPINLAYGNPYKLKQGEKREVIVTPMIMDLLRNGALVSNNIGSRQKTPLKNNSKVEDKKVVNFKQTNPIKNALNTIINTVKPHQNNKIQLNIKGIGEKTLDDINKIYLSENELQSAIKKNKVPLRDDIVLKLKEYYKKLTSKK